jgi:hypothetical protein
MEFKISTIAGKNCPIIFIDVHKGDGSNDRRESEDAQGKGKTADQRVSEIPAATETSCSKEHWRFRLTEQQAYRDDPHGK